MIWSVIFFILGCALLAELIYCLIQSNNGGESSLRRPFGLQIGGFWGMFLRLLLMVMIVALFYFACRQWFG